MTNKNSKRDLQAENPVLAKLGLAQLKNYQKFLHFAM